MAFRRALYESDDSDGNGKGILILAILAVIALVVLIAIVAVFSTRKEKTPASSIASMYDVFLGSMDQSVDPCEDFYSYVCGRQENYLPESAQEDMVSQFSEREKKLSDTLRKELLAEPHDSEPDAFEFLRDMFKDCEYNDSPDFPQMIREHVNLEITQLLSENRTDKLNLIMFHKGIDFLVDFSIVRDPLDRSRKAFRVKPYPWFRKLDITGSNVTLLGQFLTDVWGLVNRAGGKEQEIKDLAKYLSDHDFFKTPPQDHSRDRCYNQTEALALLGNFGITDFFLKHAFEDKLRLPSCILIAAPSIFAASKELFGKNKAQHIEMMKMLASTALIMEYGKYYSSKFVENYMEFNSGLDSYKHGESRVQKCIELIDRHAPLLLTRFYIDRIDRHEIPIKLLPGLVQKIVIDKLAFVIKSRDWLTPDDKTTLIDWTRQMTFEWGYPSWIGDEQVFASYSFEKNSKAFNETYAFCSLLDFRRDLYFPFHLKNPNTSFDWPVSPLSTAYVDSWDSEDHSMTVYIPMSLFGDRFYDAARDDIINIATAGSLAIQIVLKILTVKMVKETSSFIHFRSNLNDMMQIYKNISLDFLGYHELLGERVNKGEMGPVIFDGTVKLINYIWFKNEPPRVNDTRYSSRKWSWIAHVSQFCSSATLTRLGNLMRRGFIPPRYIFNNIMKSFQHFREEFKCIGHSLPLNSSHHVWLRP